MTHTHFTLTFNVHNCRKVTELFQSFCESKRMSTDNVSDAINTVLWGFSTFLSFFVFTLDITVKERNMFSCYAVFLAKMF